MRREWRWQDKVSVDLCRAVWYVMRRNGIAKRIATLALSLLVGCESAKVNLGEGLRGTMATVQEAIEQHGCGCWARLLASEGNDGRL